jgi:hypothetical protein
VASRAPSPCSLKVRCCADAPPSATGPTDFAHQSYSNLSLSQEPRRTFVSRSLSRRSTLEHTTHRYEAQVQPETGRVGTTRRPKTATLAIGRPRNAWSAIAGCTLAAQSPRRSTRSAPTAITAASPRRLRQVRPLQPRFCACRVQVGTRLRTQGGIRASMSGAKKTARTSSAFSCEIAYPARPTASRQAARSSPKYCQRTILPPLKVTT